MNEHVSQNRELLTLLSAGHFRSGAWLGERLGCSRATIWKRVQALEAMGVDIYRVRGKGYRLAHPLELLDAGLIRSHMVRRGNDCISRLDVLFDVDSTNAWLLGRPLSEGGKAHACLTEYQSNGRGRRGRRWESPLGGNLYLSLRWRFSCGAARLGGLSLAVGVVIAGVLRQFGCEAPRLKWPNDVLYEGRKLAGVLLEISGETGGPCEVVIGIGVNVTPTGMSDRDIRQPWVDLETIAGRRVSRNRLAAEILDQLVEMATRYDDEGFAAYREAWEKRAAYLSEPICLHFPERVVEGILCGVDDSGALLIGDASGSCAAYHAGEVSLRPLHLNGLDETHV